MRSSEIDVAVHVFRTITEGGDEVVANADCPVRKSQIFQFLQRVVLVDALSLEECAVSSIPSSLTVEEASEAEFKDAKVVAFCTVGYRSSQYVEALQKRGTVLDAVNLEGSILAWTHAGLPLVERRDGGEEVETDRVHVFDQCWVLMAEGFTPVTFTYPMLTALKQLTTSTLAKWFK